MGTVDGEWISSAGSKLTLSEAGTELSGVFDSTQDPGPGEPVRGSITPNIPEDLRPLSFTVAWVDDQHPAYNCVTAYSGQYHHDPATGHEHLDTIFLIFSKDQPMWKGSGISYDIFHRPGQPPPT